MRAGRDAGTRAGTSDCRICPQAHKTWSTIRQNHQCEHSWAERFPSDTNGASKFALGSYRSVAAELGEFGVTVNAVSLGPVQRWGITAEFERATLPTIPLARVGICEEVADVVLFLASLQARWMTGQWIYVGQRARV